MDMNDDSSVVAMKLKLSSPVVLYESKRSFSRLFSPRPPSPKPVDFWLEEVFAQWETHKGTAALEGWIQRGVPDVVQGLMWQKLLGNPLVVTPDLYDSVLKRVVCIRATLYSSNTRYRERVSRAFGRRASLDQNQCHGCCLGGEVEAFEQIPIDISRSLPHFGVFSSLSPNSLRTHRERLRTILECAAVHRPDIGYVQGMASLAGVFLLYLDEFSAFKCLVVTLTSTFLYDLYTFKSSALRQHCVTFTALLEDAFPKVAELLVRHDVIPESYIVPWFYTLYSVAFPEDLVKRVWDLFFLRGPIVLFQAALVTIKMHENLICLCDVDEWAPLFGNTSDLLHSVDVERFTDLLSRSALTQKKLDDVSGVHDR
ncbi:MAG: uncharacterized protein KVP18_000855 [Porospora cf. gigantea A]|uniref:uncharacterized protein n=2 Tax=Porospora cf. gigantea A TaxID=2853593 RepID=UPI00355A009D|nr:MAG: hypothetical protein KVP18_000855 [Porospora cf. gigantea A]